MFLALSEAREVPTQGGFFECARWSVVDMDEADPEAGHLTNSNQTVLSSKDMAGGVFSDEY